jgi:hypothetical protein
MISNSPFLKAMAILVCILAGFTLIMDFMIVSVMGTPDWQTLLAESGTNMNTASLMLSIAAGICALTSAILAFRRKNAVAAFWSGILYLALITGLTIMNWISSGFSWNTLISFVVPVLYLVSLCMAKE